MIRRIFPGWILSAAAAILFVPHAGAQAQVVGDWQGVASIQGADYHIVVHIAAAAGGALAATLDSPELGVTGVATSGVVFKDGKFSMNVEAYHGVYTGTLSADGSKITGAFEGDQETPIDFTRMGGAAAAPAVAAATAAGASIAGDWHGTLEAGGKMLRLVLHVAAATDGALTGTLDSLDQGIAGIPLTTVVLKDSRLSLAVDAVHGSYEGTLRPDGTGIDGTWTQGQPMPLNFARGSAADVGPSKAAAPSDMDGTWAGTLDANGQTLRILLKLTNTTDGLTAQLQSPDQSVVWLAANSVSRGDGTLTASFAAIQAQFAGKIAADRNSIDGTFTQGAVSTPLVLKRTR